MHFASQRTKSRKMDFESKYIDKATMKKFKIELSYESVIPLLGIYPKEIKSVLYFSDCKTHFPPPKFGRKMGVHLIV